MRSTWLLVTLLAAFGACTVIADVDYRPRRDEPDVLESAGDAPAGAAGSAGAAS